MAALLEVLIKQAETKSAGGVAPRVRSQVWASVWSEAAYLPPELPLPEAARFIRRCRFQGQVSLLPYKAAIAFPRTRRKGPPCLAWARPIYSDDCGESSMQIASFRESDNLPANESSPERELLPHDITLPLVVDLDGTLIATDALHESLIFFLKRRGAEAWKVPYWIGAGRAIVKNRLAEVVTEEDVASFPVNAGLVRFAEQEASCGRQIVLATAADLAIAQKVQQRFPFISHVIASTDGRNLKGLAKAEEVMRQFPDGFIYAGDSASDLHVWDRASAAIFVGRSTNMEKKITTRTELAAVFPTKTLNFPSLRRGLRLHQWAKNALVFVPLILGGKAHDSTAWLHGLAGFAALSLLASATYVLMICGTSQRIGGTGRKDTDRSPMATCRSRPASA